MPEEKHKRNVLKETVSDCPLLYDMVGRPCTETCICWGWEHADGWNDITETLSRQLETLNGYFYPKFRLRIQADQIKEKYGEYRFYWSIVQDSCAFLTWIANRCRQLNEHLSDHKKFDYKTVRVTDIGPYDYDDTKEISEERYREVTDPNYKGIRCSNVEYVEKDGKHFEVCHLRNYGKNHIEPTKHKLLWKIKELSGRLYHRLKYGYKDNAKIRNAIATMTSIAEELIRKAEQECEKHCEECGHQIGTEWSPTCTTRGWISNICDECAEKLGVEYYKNGELWIGDKMLKSKEEIDKDRKSKYDEEV